MLTLTTERIGDVAIVECKGRIVRSEAALKLRNAITSQRDARVVVLDLTEVSAIEGGGLGMLWYLQRWAEEHGIGLKLFHPTGSVKKRLEEESPVQPFHIATIGEMVILLALAENLRNLPHGEGTRSLSSSDTMLAKVSN
jgi:anti-anti-sigma regulatory factor